MYPSHKKTASVDSTDLLESNRPTSNDGPINLLPNEMLQAILANLELTGTLGTSALVRSRMVSTRWLSVVDDYCQKKKSLIVNYSSIKTTYGFSKLSVASDYPLLVNLKAVEFFGKMLKQFPNIEQLKICNIDWPTSQLRLEHAQSVAVSIDSMRALKQLELVGTFTTVIPFLSQTLSKLEFLGIGEFLDYLNENDLHQMVSRLGPDCVRVHIGSTLELNYILHWHQIKPNWLANLIHFQMNLCQDSEMRVKVVRFLSEHATSLQILNIFAFYKTLVVTPSMIRDFGKLSHLTKLLIFNITMDITELEQAALQNQLTSLTSILTCRLYFYHGGPASAAQFVRVLSVIFPNLINLNLKLYRKWASDAQFRTEIEQHLNLFPNLRKRNIQFFY